MAIVRARLVLDNAIVGETGIVQLSTDSYNISTQQMRDLFITIMDNYSNSEYNYMRYSSEKKDEVLSDIIAIGMTEYLSRQAKKNVKTAEKIVVEDVTDTIN